MRNLIVLLLLFANTSHAGIIRQNVRHFSKQGSTGLIGDVTISEGSNITLTQIGQNITVAASAGGSVLSRATKTTSYALANSDDVILEDTSSSSLGLLLQSSASATSKMYWVENIGGFDVSVTTTGSDLINGLSSQTLSPGASFILFPDGGTSWYNFSQ